MRTGNQEYDVTVENASMAMWAYYYAPFDAIVADSDNPDCWVITQGKFEGRVVEKKYCKIKGAA